MDFQFPSQFLVYSLSSYSRSVVTRTLRNRVRTGLRWMTSILLFLVTETFGCVVFKENKGDIELLRYSKHLIGI